MKIVRDPARGRTVVPVWFFAVAAGAAAANAIQGDETEGGGLFALLVVSVSLAVVFWEMHGYTLRWQAS